MIFIGSWTSYTLLGVDSWGAERVGAEPFLGYMFLVLGHLIPYLGLIPLGAEVHPEGHGSSGAMSSFPRAPRNPLHPRIMVGLGAHPLGEDLGLCGDSIGFRPRRGSKE